MSLCEAALQKLWAKTKHWEVFLQKNYKSMGYLVQPNVKFIVGEVAVCDMCEVQVIQSSNSNNSNSDKKTNLLMTLRQKQ